MKYAKGKHALGVCDRCGLTYNYSDLYEEYDENGIANGLKVCDDCLDHDIDQDPKVEDDAIALHDPRPDLGITMMRAMFGWKPVTGMKGKLSLGIVRVTV